MNGFATRRGAMGAEACGPPREIPEISIVIALPQAYDQPRLVNSLFDALEVVGSTAVSDTEEDRLGPVRAVVVVDGWGRTPLPLAASRCQRFTCRPALLAILNRTSCTVVEALDAGFDDCARWPLPPDEVAARVRATLRRSERWQESTSIVLDPLNLSVRCGGVKASLTRGQFGVLSELVRQPRRWMRSEDLLRATLGERGRDTTQIRNHIHALRRKLGPEAWRIRWHRSLGYFFDASIAKSP